MGTARYYMRAEFGSEEKAESALLKIKKFLKEAKKAQDYWQANRDMEYKDQRSQFWDKFSTLYPEVSKYLDVAGYYGGECNNTLAGRISFGGSDEINIELYGDEVRYNAEVWHFANWTMFGKFLKTEYGARKFGYVSDEYAIDYYGQIQMDFI